MRHHTPEPASDGGPSLADQVSRLYELIAGFHATHLLEIARELGVWEALTQRPGLSSDELSRQLGTDPFRTDVLCRTAFSFGLLVRDEDGWRMGPRLDEILGNPASSFYLGRAARIHMMVGKDYRDYVDLFRTGRTKPYQDHGPEFMEEIAQGLGSLPRIFLDHALPHLPRLNASLSEWRPRAGRRVWRRLGDRADRRAVPPGPMRRDRPRSPFGRPGPATDRERGLQDRCEARVESVDRLDEDDAYDLVTSFLVVHEIAPALKASAFAAVARALRPGGCFLVFDEAYPETDEALTTMPTRFAALAQWYEVTWGNVVNTRSELHALCRDAGLDVVEETGFSRFHILVAARS